MAEPKKAPAKKAPAKGRTTARKISKPPTLRPSRFAAFESASAEWQDEPIGFDLDGKLWLCEGTANSQCVAYLGAPKGVSSSEFIAAAIIEKEAWAEMLASNPVPGKLLQGVATFLIRAYTGQIPGK